MVRDSSPSGNPRAADRRLAVSTECPTCAAPLDFSEGSNAIRCQHCRSNLLVTGRGQILSYAIQPRVSEQAARNTLRAVPIQAGSRISNPVLFFVPFYRVTGHEFAWRRPAPAPRVDRALSELTGDTSRDLEWGPWGGGYGSTTLAGLLFEAASAIFEKLTEVKESPREIEPGASPPPRKSLGMPEHGSSFEPVEFTHRHIEKNFVASDHEGVGLYSLGVRSAVLRLELFDPAKLSSAGRLLPVGLDAATALERGLMSGDRSVLSRTTAGAVVSLIYFPLWIARLEELNAIRHIALDGVTGGIASRDVSEKIFEKSEPATDIRPVVAGFRPLVCPNCGWDLPVHPDDAIFFCATCRRAWKIERNELRPIAHQFASIQNVEVSGDDLYLPFWVSEHHTSDGPRRVFAPAFRYRQLRHLEMLGSRLTRMQPKFELASEPVAPVHGVHYDESDGLALTRFLQQGIDLRNRAETHSAPPENLQLVWIPFRRRGNFLFDPFVGSNLFANLLH